MNKHLRPVALLSLLLLAFCKNTPPPPPPEAIVNSEDSTKSSTPDPGDLLRTLQGRWQSEQDASYTLEFADTQMRHFYGNKLTHESTIEVDGACENPLCRPTGVDTSDGWCFTEKTIEQEKSSTQCNFVITCDTSKLKFRSLSVVGPDLTFKKIQ